MNRQDYINLRNKYFPKNLKTIFVLESPPASCRYFYKPEGRVTEPLFSAMMKCVLKFQPKNKKEKTVFLRRRSTLLRHLRIQTWRIDKGVIGRYPWVWFLTKIEK